MKQEREDGATPTTGPLPASNASQRKLCGCPSWIWGWGGSLLRSLNWSPSFSKQKKLSYGIIPADISDAPVPLKDLDPTQRAFADLVLGWAIKIL